ncbi:MAG: hypothetical protein IT434_02910 [Phycisphaerales bacterium]|jgi:hypothetical protein|nr:hypothetical protein [Phycisphaerales bacterium]
MTGGSGDRQTDGGGGRDDATRVLTWAALLGKWTELARASLAFPKTSQGAKWRKSVPDLIGLQAITHALGEFDLLREEEQGLALDRAALGIETHATNLVELFADDCEDPELEEGLTGIEEIDELIDEARGAWDIASGGSDFEEDDDAEGGLEDAAGDVEAPESEHAGGPETGREAVEVESGEVKTDHSGEGSGGSARSPGFEWCVEAERIVGEHPAELIEQLLELGFDGEVYVPSPGSVLFRGEPAAYASGGASMEVVEIVESFVQGVGDARRGERRQVYRLTDFATGKIVKDVVIDADAVPPGGQPQLVCAMKDGQACAVSLAPKWVSEIGRVRVEFVEARR